MHFKVNRDLDQSSVYHKLCCFRLKCKLLKYFDSDNKQQTDTPCLPVCGKSPSTVLLFSVIFFTSVNQTSGSTLLLILRSWNYLVSFAERSLLLYGEQHYLFCFTAKMFRVILCGTYWFLIPSFLVSSNSVFLFCVSLSCTQTLKNTLR